MFWLDCFSFLLLGHGKCGFGILSTGSAAGEGLQGSILHLQDLGASNARISQGEMCCSRRAPEGIDLWNPWEQARRGRQSTLQRAAPCQPGSHLAEFYGVKVSVMHQTRRAGLPLLPLSPVLRPYWWQHAPSTRCWCLSLSCVINRYYKLGFSQI